MSKKLYIAYGSNLNLKQMKYRCPTAKLIGKGVVENYGLQFKGMPPLFLCNNRTLHWQVRSRCIVGASAER